MVGIVIEVIKIGVIDDVVADKFCNFKNDDGGMVFLSVKLVITPVRW